MNKNPYLNAIIAVAYIAFVAFFMNTFGKMVPNTDKTLLGPIVFLCLFVTSAAVMGFLFVYAPLVLHLSGDKTGAVKFFAKTLGTFAIIGAILALTLVVFRPM